MADRIYRNDFVEWCAASNVRYRRSRLNTSSFPEEIALGLGEVVYGLFGRLWQKRTGDFSQALRHFENLSSGDLEDYLAG